MIDINETMIKISLEFLGSKYKDDVVSEEFCQKYYQLLKKECEDEGCDLRIPEPNWKDYKR